MESKFNQTGRSTTNKPKHRAKTMIMVLVAGLGLLVLASCSGYGHHWHGHNMRHYYQGGGQDHYGTTGRGHGAYHLGPR